MSRNLFTIAVIVVALVVAGSAGGAFRAEAGGISPTPKPTPVRHAGGRSGKINRPHRLEGDPDQPIVVGSVKSGGAGRQNSSSSSASSLSTAPHLPGFAGSSNDGQSILKTDPRTNTHKVQSHAKSKRPPKHH